MPDQPLHRNPDVIEENSGSEVETDVAPPAPSICRPVYSSGETNPMEVPPTGRTITNLSNAMRRIE